MHKYYNEIEQLIVYLDYLGISKKKLQEFMSCVKTIQEAKSLCKTSLNAKELLGETINHILDPNLENNLLKVIEFLNEKNIYFTTFKSADFPPFLLEVSPVPSVIYYKGDIKVLSSSLIIGVVGTRKPTRYGRSVTEKFCTELGANGIITISGLAYGIDSEVARTAIKNKDKTIAVLGGGLGQIYPSSNISLANEIIINGGLVLSEYFPTVRPTKYSFPERNRLISGLSGGLLVIEAGLKSGSLITAMHALEQGKELFVVPGNVDSKESEGSNKLIEELPHSFTISPTSIIEYFGIKTENKKTVVQNYTIEEMRVIKEIESDPKTFDELCELLKEDAKTLNLLLTEMEISGIIKKLPGNYYGI